MCSHAPCFPAKVSERTAVSCRHEDILYVLLFPLSSVLVYYRIPIADASCLSTDPSYTQTQRASSVWFIPSRDATPFIADKMGRYCIFCQMLVCRASAVSSHHVFILVLSFTVVTSRVCVREREGREISTSFLNSKLL